MVSSTGNICSFSPLVTVLCPSQCLVASIITFVVRLVYRSLISKVMVLWLGFILSLFSSSPVFSEFLLL